MNRPPRTRVFHRTTPGEVRPTAPPLDHRPSEPRPRPTAAAASKRPILPPPKLGDIRIIPLGGVEEIGKNMTAIEIGRDIIVIDIGLAFPGEETPGIDYIIPDVSYLEANRERVRAVVITHAHLDHIGGIAYVMPRIGNPPIYTRHLTGLFLRKRQEEFPHLPALKIIEVETEERVRVGNQWLRFFGVTHTIPDSMGVIIETLHGLIVNPGDYKLDLDRVGGAPTAAEEQTYSVFDREPTLLLLADSTNIENPGFSIPERETVKNLEEIVKNTRGRLFIGTFASQLERLIKVIGAAEKCGRKIIIEGRSMKTNIEVATKAGLLKMKKETIIPATAIGDYPDDKILVLATGAQGEEFAALMRIATKVHKTVRFKRGDTVVLSSSIIPGNERTVEKLKDNMARQGAKIVHYRSSEVYIHSSGHGNRGEIEWLHRKIKPRFFIPIHSNHHRLRLHAELAMELGMPEDHIVVPDNGSVIEITASGQKIQLLKEKVGGRMVMVDGLGTDNVEEVVIRDRQMLAQDGMFVIIAIIDVKTGKVRKSPDIISRGFIYLKEAQELLRGVRLLAKRKIEESTGQMHPINFDYLKNLVREEVGRYLFQKTHNRPIILPVLIEV